MRRFPRHRIFAATTVCLGWSAQAQQADPVTLYGQVYAQLETVEARGGAVPIPRRNRIGDETSRLGVRGREHVGDTIVWFQLETAFPVDAPLLNDQRLPVLGFRNSGIGVSGAWGTLMAGMWDSAFHNSQTAVDPFGDLGLASITSAALNGGNFARRENNTVQYWSPRVRGFQLRVSYAANEGRNAALNPYDYGAMVSLRNDATYVSVAFEKHSDRALTLPTVATVDEEGVGLAAWQQVGPVRISAQYGAYRRTGWTTQKSYIIGLQWVSERHEFLGTYQASDGGAPPLVVPIHPSCTLVGVGYRYRFSTRTVFLAEVVRIWNKAGVQCNFGTNPLTPLTSGQELRGIGVGMRTRF